MDALLKTYDTNDDGILFTTSMKKINADLVTTAAVIMPAIVHGVDLDEADAQANEEVDNQVNEANGLIFGNNLQVDAERLKKAFGKEVSFLLNSVKLRSKFAVKIGTKQEASEK